MSEDVNVKVTQEPPKANSIGWLREATTIVKDLGVLGGIGLIAAVVCWPGYGLLDKMNLHAEKSEVRYVTFGEKQLAEQAKIAEKLVVEQAKVAKELHAAQEKSTERVTSAIHEVSKAASEVSKSAGELSREMKRRRDVDGGGL